jgi:hypothetical protein
MVHVTMRLSECWRECPKPNIADTMFADDRKLDAGKEDARFLAALGVKFPESK